MAKNSCAMIVWLWLLATPGNASNVNSRSKLQNNREELPTSSVAVMQQVSSPGKPNRRLKKVRSFLSFITYKPPCHDNRLQYCSVASFIPAKEKSSTIAKSHCVHRPHYFCATQCCTYYVPKAEQFTIG